MEWRNLLRVFETVKWLTGYISAEFQRVVRRCWPAMTPIGHTCAAQSCAGIEERGHVIRDAEKLNQKGCCGGPAPRRNTHHCGQSKVPGGNALGLAGLPNGVRA